MARTSTKSGRVYGWTPDRPDHRDHVFVAKAELLKALPAAVDLRANCPAVLNQLQLGACTGNAIANAHRFAQMKEKPGKDFAPSRLFIYYNERAMEGTTSSDSGANIRDGIKSINQLGVCKETTVPYDIAKFAKKPSAAAYKEGLLHQSVNYKRVAQDLNTMKACLAGGYPFVDGFTVYESFESAKVAKTGIVPMPKANEEELGGHATLVVGYNDAKGWFIVMNSWDITWGDKGFYYIPYEYLTNSDLASDFWTISTVED